MLIKSEFRDYYDGVQQYGQDNDFVYQRFQKTEDFVKNFGELKNLLKIQSSHQDSNRNLMGSSCIYGNHYLSKYWINFKKIYIGFCGKIHTAFKITIHQNNDLPQEVETHYCYNLQDIEDVVNTQGKKVIEEFYKKKEKKSRYGKSRYSYFEFSKKYFDNNDEFVVYENDLISNIFEKNYCPVFFIKHTSSNENYIYKEKIEMIYNYELAKIDFFRKFDCYQAYQNIRMYLSSLAVPLKPIPELDDITMRDIKGFDKFSFRKDKKN
jgi:hypothetical protein